MSPLEELMFDPLTGHFSWSVSRHKCVFGKRAGYINKRGYWEITVHGKRYLAHRLVWLLRHGKFPNSEIDHINGDKTDNRLSNLRLATRGQNAANMKRHADTASGLKGAYYDKRRRKWFSSIGRKFLGYFLSADDAHLAYCNAARAEFGEFFNSGKMERAT